MQLSETTALVTGGASGLGAAVVRQIAGAGGRALIADLNAEGGEALAGELGANVAFARCNVTDEDDVNAALDAAAKLGQLNLVVNCAGVGTPAKVLSRDGEPLQLADFTKVLNINLVGTFNVIRLAAARMAENEPNTEGERGVVVNTASVAAFDGQIGQPAYSASKAGVVGMTLPIAREFARYGIRVMTIAPGLFKTPLLEALPEEAQQSLGASVPFPARLGRPDEFAQLVGDIVENAMLNGETIRLDGALRMAPK